MRLFRTHRRLKAVLALSGALLLTADAAGAHHDLQSTVSQSTYVKDLYPDITSGSVSGAYTPATSKLEIATGYRVAHADATTSPITPVPNNGDDVGTGTARARWQPFCFPESNLSLDLTWDSTPSGGPTGTVGQVTVEAAGGLFTTQAYIVQNGTNDYDIVVPTMPSSSVCSSTTAGSTTLTITGTVAGSSPARRVVRNPATAGNYTTTGSYTDNRTPAGDHSDSNTVTITN